MRRPEAQEKPPGPSLVLPNDRLQRLAFVAAIGLSAFLLFSLELRAGRLVLPVFGGAPAVWTTSLCFFTAVLFLGYVYAHFVATRVSFRTAGAVQLGLSVAVVVVAVIAPTHLASLRVSGIPAGLNVLLVLAVIAGGPAFLLATTTPLLSAWYAAPGDNPWWLFAVSNGASFLALLAYPLLVAPYIGFSDQRILLIVGLTVYTASLVIIVLGLCRGAAPAAPAAEPVAALSGRRQVVWLVAALVPAGLLSATTNFLQTDLISAPLIWIGPLAVYLASFVVAFTDRGRPLVRACDWLVPVAATLLWIPFIKPGGWPPTAVLGIELGALFVLAVAIHGRLAADRPGAGRLTRFYLILTAGGALGTAFVSLVAPVIFNDVYEYPLLIIAGLLVLVLLPGEKRPALPRVRPYRVRLARIYLTRAVVRVLAYSAVATLIYLLVDARGSGLARDVRALLFFGGIVVFLAFTPRALAVVAPITIVILMAVNWTSPLVRDRTFFGVVEVRQSEGIHEEYSGTTLHGLQFTDDRRTEPTTYYTRLGPLGSVFDNLRTRTTEARIGVVGLGVGTIAAYAQPGDQMTFYEINSAVVDIARNPAYFTYLADAAVAPQIVLGDARLSLEDRPTGSFDLLILDAFSSDSVPAHLLTKESIQTYVRTLRPGGVLAFHLSNRYYDLVPPVAATARSTGLNALTLQTPIPGGQAEDVATAASVWLVVGSRGDIQGLVRMGWSSAPEGGYVLTDDYSDLTRSLDWGGF
jgi:SAM-dependent methyltransferase